MMIQRINRLAKLASVAFFVSTTADAQYIGLERERLVSLLTLQDASAAPPGLREAYAHAASRDWNAWRARSNARRRSDFE